MKVLYIRKILEGTVRNRKHLEILLHLMRYSYFIIYYNMRD